MKQLEPKLEPKLELKLIRNLNISAASGLLFLDKRFYVVADDELHLSAFSSNENTETENMRLFDGNLSEDLETRKKQKPDFECLVFIASLNAMLVLPSGSRPQRMRGVFVQGQKKLDVHMDLLYQHLATHIHDLNIEGAVELQNELLLFSRGNGENGKNVLISLDLAKFLEELQVKKVTAASFKHLQVCELGEISGHHLGFTDAAVEGQQRIWFLAASEGAKSTYDDGKFLGAVLGCMNSKGEVLFQQPLNVTAKPEGLALDLKRRKFYVVTDADDRNQPAQLLEGNLDDVEQTGAAPTSVT